MAQAPPHPDGALSLGMLVPQGEAELDVFLREHCHSSLYLRAQLRRGGAGFAVARRQGRIVGAAVQLASGMVLLQAPTGAASLSATVLRHGGRRLAGFFGPIAQVDAALTGLELDGLARQKHTHEDLFALALADLCLPPVLANKQAICRVAGAADLEHLVAWRAAFRQATFNEAPGALLESTSRADIAALLPAGSLFILESGVPLACCSFNARLPDIVQIGNVWTPPGLRGNGYARAVVAGALAIAGRSGVTEAVLSTGRKNVAAQAAYRGIGFKLAGDYACTILAPDVALPDF